MRVSMVNDDVLRISAVKNGHRYRESPAVVVKANGRFSLW